MQGQRNRVSKTVNRIFTNRIICWTVAAALGWAVCGAFSARAAELEDGGLDVVQVRPNFYMIAGAGGNIGVQIGSDGIVLVNAGDEAASGQILAALRKLTNLPIRYVIDAEAGADFVGGNEKLAKSGLTIFTNAIGNAGLAGAMTNGGTASILAHDSVLRRMSAPTGKTSPYPGDAWPTEAFFQARKAIRMNDEGIEILPEQHFTEPPPRFTEATLVKELEAKGVGRPSTYASILSTIQEREYVRKDGGKFTPTELGMVVTDLLLESFDDLFDVTYTARMEGQLDDIEEGKPDWRVAMSEFYERFEKDLKHAERHMTDIKRMEEPTDQICEKCGKPMVIKWGRHGKFIACTGYPDCTNTREIAQEGVTEQDEAVYCDNCGRPMVLKKGRFGQFLACSGYPDCKTTKQLGAGQKPQDVPLDEACPQCSNKLVKKFGRFGEFIACSNYPTCKYVKQKTIGVKCPNCSAGEIIERRSKRGKTFYGCNRYPECDFVAWGKPIAEKCPQCGGSYMIEKYLKAGAFAQCPNDECKFKKPLEVVQAPVEAVV